MTQSADLDDHFPAAGEVLDLRLGSQVLIGAEEETCLLIETSGGRHRSLLALLCGPAGLKPAATVPG